MQVLDGIDSVSATDEELLLLIGQKNTQAYEILYDRHAQTVYSLLVCMVNDDALAEELLEAIFWQLWEEGGVSVRGGSVATWLCRAARMKIMHLRRQGGSSEQRRQVTQLSQPMPSEAMAENTTYQQLSGYLQQLSHEQRRCLELAYFSGMSLSEIAETIILPVASIKESIRSGMEKLEQLRYSPAS